MLKISIFFFYHTTIRFEYLRHYACADGSISKSVALRAAGGYESGKPERQPEHMARLQDVHRRGEEAGTMDGFVKLFNKKAPRKGRWTSVLTDKDTYFTCVHKAIYEGLEFIFSGVKD